MSALTWSLHHELADKGVHVQAVLPGAMATDFWGVAGTPLEAPPWSIVMSVADIADGALAGLAAGEIPTIPSLPEQEDWSVFEKARKTLAPSLSRPVAAARYSISRPV